MNKSVIIGIVAVVVLIVGGGAAYVLTSSDQKSEATKSSSSTHPTTKTSLSELLQKGDPRKCTYEGTIESGEYSGTAYFSSDKQMRNDYKSVSDGKARNGSMIITTDTQYFWDTETKKGFKTAVQANESSSQQSSENQDEGVDTNATFEFHCNSWEVDESKFSPPSDVQIQDLTQIMQNIPTPGQ